MNPWDFQQPLETIFGHSVEVLRMQLDDTLIVRYSSKSSMADLRNAVEQFERALPGKRILFVSEDWEIALARPANITDTIDGLTELQKALGT